MKVLAIMKEERETEREVGYQNDRALPLTQWSSAFLFTYCQT
jgi:hypothetical protein